MNFICLARKNNEKIKKKKLVGFTILLILHLFIFYFLFLTEMIEAHITFIKKINNLFGQMGFKG